MQTVQRTANPPNSVEICLGPKYSERLRRVNMAYASLQAVRLQDRWADIAPLGEDESFSIVEVEADACCFKFPPLDSDVETKVDAASRAYQVHLGVEATCDLLRATTSAKNMKWTFLTILNMGSHLPKHMKWEFRISMKETQAIESYFCYF